MSGTQALDFEISSVLIHVASKFYALTFCLFPSFISHLDDSPLAPFQPFERPRDSRSLSLFSSGDSIYLQAYGRVF